MLAQLKCDLSVLLEQLHNRDSCCATFIKELVFCGGYRKRFIHGVILYFLISTIIFSIGGCVNKSEFHNECSSSMLGMSANRDLCESLVLENSLLKVVITPLVDENIKRVTITDKNELEKVRRNLFTMKRKVFIYDFDGALGAPPSYKIEIFLEKNKITLWLFPIGFSSCNYITSPTTLYSMEFAYIISSLLKKYNGKGLEPWLLKYLRSHMAIE